MVRRATRSPGSRPRAARPAVAGDPLRTLRALAEQRGSAKAEELLERWMDAVTSQPGVFEASAELVADPAETLFPLAERWYLASMLAELAMDPVFTPTADDLGARLDEEARSWPGNEAEQMSDDELKEASPLFLALSEALGAVELAMEVGFLCRIGLTDMARAMLHDADGRYARLLRDGEATLLGVPRIVLDAGDDPFGILHA